MKGETWIMLFIGLVIVSLIARAQTSDASEPSAPSVPVVTVTVTHG